MPEISTYPLFDALVDNDSFLGVSSVNGRTRRGSIAQLREAIVTSNIATEEDVNTFTNTSRLMTLQRTRDFVDAGYAAPQLLGSGIIDDFVDDVTLNTEHSSPTHDVTIVFRRLNFTYLVSQPATIRFDVSYNAGNSYPTTNQRHQAMFTVNNATTYGGGANLPVILLPGATIMSPMLVNITVRILGGGTGLTVRMYEWRGSVEYSDENYTVRVGLFSGVFTTTNNQWRISRFRLSSGDGQPISTGRWAMFLTPGMF